MTRTEIINELEECCKKGEYVNFLGRKVLVVSWKKIELSCYPDIPPAIEIKFSDETVLKLN
jgi:hypothetical protein